MILEVRCSSSDLWAEMESADMPMGAPGADMRTELPSDELTTDEGEAGAWPESDRWEVGSPDPLAAARLCADPSGSDEEDMSIRRLLPRLQS